MHYGTHIKMGINWKVYVASLVRGIKKVIQPQWPLVTRNVSEERRLYTEEMLPKLRMAEDCPIFITHDRALFFLRVDGALHVVLFLATSDSIQIDAISAYAEARGQQKKSIKILDAHHFFLHKNAEIEVLSELPQPLEDFLLSQVFDVEEGKRKGEKDISVDFDKACEAYGRILAWSVGQDEGTADFVDLLLLNGLRRYQHSSSIRVAVEKGFPAAHVVDLSKICDALVAPISLALDHREKPAGIYMPNAGCVILESLGIKVSDDVTYGVGGGACLSFTHANQRYVALSVRGLRQWELSELPNLLRQYGVLRDAFTQAHLIALVSKVPGALQLSASIMPSDESLENLVPLDENKLVELDSLNATFESLEIFNVDNSADLVPARVLAILAVNFRNARASFITAEIAEVAKKLVNNLTVPVENIYLSLSAAHWKHCFIEAYRIVEGLYYFAWMHGLRAALKSTISEYELSIHCQSTMSWKYSEESSIKELLALVPVDALIQADPKTIPCLATRLSGKNDSADIMRSMANSIYSIRNANVHQGEGVSDQPINVTANCWPRLTLSLYLIIEYFYTKHPSGVPTGPGK